MEGIEFLLDADYRARGWNQNSLPTEAKLKTVGLQDLAESLKMPGLLF